MKQQKWSLIISVIIASSSLTLYLVGAFCDFNENEVVKDIFIAIFSSSIFVIASSIIGYLIEKKRQIKSVFASSSCELESFFTVADENNYLNRQGFNIILLNLINGLRNTKYLLEEYYYGCFFKDKEVKNLINDNIYPFYQFLCEFYSYNVSSERKGEELSTRFDDLVLRYKKFLNALDNWLGKK